MSTFKMKCPAGKLIPRAPTMHLGVVPKWQKFYNWPRDKDGSPLPDAPGFPTGDEIPEMVVEAPMDQHHALLVAKTACSVVDDVPAPAPVPVTKKKADK